LFLAEMALAFDLASSLDDAPQAFRDNSKRVGLPSFISGPGILPIRARKEARLGLSPLFTGGLDSHPFPYCTMLCPWRSSRLLDFDQLLFAK
jgi:hypothetical protein